MHCSQIRNAVLWQAMRMQDDLIYDVGLHSGKDTEFYLAKRFRVVAIEANPVLASRCKTKFASQIKEGRLHILQLAIGEQAGNCDFFVCDQHDDWSTIDRRDRLKSVQMPGKMARSDPRPSVRVIRGAGSGQHLASVLQEGRENANIDAGLGFIWGISVLNGNRTAKPQLWPNVCRFIDQPCKKIERSVTDGGSLYQRSRSYCWPRPSFTVNPFYTGTLDSITTMVPSW